MDPKERFSNRVDDYVTYRPSYPAALIEKLTALAQLGPGRVVADVGSGTGILTGLLLATGARVIGVEPNTAMRSAAERALAAVASFESRDGSAEATGLPEASVDLVTAAQAFHWFDPVAARAEFARILRPGGNVALVWNQRRDTPLNREYEAMLERYAPDYGNVRERDRAAEPKIRVFFSPAPVDLATFDNRQRLDEAGLRGRLTSSSYAPAPPSPLYEPMMRELASIFRTHARDGAVVIEYETILWYGQLQ
jgi:SAM-dependent methyltransferase